MRVEETVRNYAHFLNGCYSDIEVLVITDGCSDRTPQIVDELSKKYKCIKHIHPDKRLGKGGAVIEGFKAATGKVIGFVDSDGSTPADDLHLLLNELSGCDGVIASRWLSGSNVMKHEPPLRIVASRGFNFLIKILFGLPFNDTQCGAKFFKNEVIKDIITDLGLTDWSFDVELLYIVHERGYHIKEVPVKWEYKEGSKLNLRKVSINMLISIIGFRIKKSPLAPLIPNKLAYILYRKME
ncbi:glycosyltransferase family 2 protein [Candidatus Pacearchaeota archaeon]|nr:glycosyltransferase family 2 protein [Candidatus Pacearchaeota archaeon]